MNLPIAFSVDEIKFVQNLMEFVDTLQIRVMEYADFLNTKSLKANRLPLFI